MGLRIKELCRERGVTLTEIAEQLGISPITLSQSLNGNPTMKRLSEVAAALNVETGELFENNKYNDIHGCIFVEGEPKLIKSRKDIESLLAYMDKNS